MSETKNGSRWWEFNLVRYFLGTLVGSFIVYLVFNHFVDGLKGIKDYEFLYNKLCDLQSLSTNYNQWFYLGAGFVFCYISSSPILVFHATRLRKSKKSFKFFVNSTILFFSFFIAFIFLVLSVNYSVNKCMWMTLLGILLFSIFQIYLLYNSKENKAIELYKRLTEKRETITTLNIKSQTTEPNGRKTYIESYQHLREHGNAFFIVILEVVFGLLLFQINTPKMMIACIVIWLLPGSLIWFFGNYLESDLC